MIDIDSTIVADLTQTVHRGEDFVIWGDPRFSFATYCGAAWMLRLGTRQHVWDSFDPARSPALAKAAGCNGSDQGWISYCLWPNEAVWTREDGLLSARWIKSGLPGDAVMVQFAGRLKPWDPAAQKRWPWINKHWRL